MWGEILTSQEVEFCVHLVDRLTSLPGARPLISKLGVPESWKYQTKPFLFELRFAGELAAADLAFTYEHPTNVGSSTVDFRFDSGGEWWIECVSLLTSRALKNASWERGLFFGADLASNSADRTQSVEGEALRAQGKIGEKVCTTTGPTKFALPRPGSFHVLLVDMRGFAITGGDIWDYRQIAYGRTGLPADMQHLAYYWSAEDGSRHPILGLFDPANTYQRAAKYLQERIHFLAFCNDESYTPDGIRSHTIFLPNPHLFNSDTGALAAYLQYPLRPRPVQ